MAPNSEEPHPWKTNSRRGDLERQVAAFVDHYNHCRYHEIFSSLTSVDIYFGRGDIIMLERKKDQTRNHQTAPLASSRSGRLKEQS